MHRIDVPLPGRAYPILIAPGALAELIGLRREHAAVRRVAVVADAHVADLHLQQLVDACGDQPPNAILRFPPGEASKTLETAARLYGELAAAQVGRRDLILTFGGGVAGDLGGFLAATWLRGVSFLQIPTTLEAAIDASIGGKTAVNTPAGKNLVGAFHQPIAVVVDTDLLATLPRREYIAGLAESVKHALIADPDLLAWHEQHADRLAVADPDLHEELIARNCAIKAEVVVADEREAGRRMLLNFGHTVGHAIEHLLGYELRHGECVALGMLVAVEISRGRGGLSTDDVTRIRDLLTRLGLPTRLPRTLDDEQVLAVCRQDKKVLEAKLNFVVLDRLGAASFTTDVSEDDICAALDAIRPA